MRVISGVGAALPEGYYGRMAQYRYRVFVEHLGWSLNSVDGIETDQFDCESTRYIVIENEEGEIAGCSEPVWIFVC